MILLMAENRFAFDTSNYLCYISIENDFHLI
jgi:hypothetical protein